MGMPEYHDGSFGPIKPVEESLKDLLDSSTGELERTKALHIGKIEELVALASEQKEDEPLAKILQIEFGQLRMDVNKIMIHLGIDDKSVVLPVKDLPK